MRLYGEKDIQSSTPDGLNKRAIITGALLWLAFSVVVVALRGVRWDESFQFAQVLLDLIPYPDDHPMVQHVNNMFCAQTYLSAAVMWLDPNPLFTCGYRNILHFLIKLLPFFLFGTLLTRRIMGGHITALLAFLAGQGFWNVYPSYWWPIVSANGAIGLGFALLSLYFVCADRPRLAFAFAAAMPAIHIGQCPPVLAIACLYFVHSVWTRRPHFLREALSGLAIGLCVTALSGAVYLYARVPPPESGPYFSNVPWKNIWLGFMHGYNYHRELKFGEDQIVLVWMALLGTATAYLEFKDGKRGPWLWLGLYGWVVCVIVWATMAAHYALGDHLPPIFTNWLPYRLANHLTPLLVVMMAALIMKSAPNYIRDSLLLAPLLAVAFGANASHAFLLLGGMTTYFVYLRLQENRPVAYGWLALTGAACFLLWLAFDAYAYWWMAGWALAIAVALYETLAPPANVHRYWQHAAACACAIIVAHLLWGQWQGRNNIIERLEQTPFEQQTAAYLAQHAAPDTMLILPMQLWCMQERLGYPVITEAASLSWIPYHKTIGQALWKIYKDIYGVDLTSYTPMQSWLASYRNVWTKRTPAQWAQIGHEYNSQFVIAPDFIDLQLPLLIESKTLRLYQIPAT